jgi:outer membrane receptor for ferrienterochelin and colicins
VPSHRITLGAELRDDLRLDQRNLDATATYLDDRRDGSVVGLFLQDEFLLAERWRLEAGVRYDHYYTFGGTTNPRVALVYNPDEASALKLLYGRAFRAPNAYESYYADGFSAKANPDLDPETIRTLEAVYERTWATGWRLASSLYHYRILDLIVQVIDPLDGLLLFENADSVRATGIEVELERRFANGARVQWSHALQRAEIESSGTRLTNSPAHLSQLLAEVPLGGPWRGGVDLQALSERDTLGGGDVPGYVVANLVVRAPDLVRGLDLDLAVTNLLDAEIRDPGGSEHLQDELLQEGRAVWVRLTWRP